MDISTAWPYVLSVASAVVGSAAFIRTVLEIRELQLKIRNLRDGGSKEAAAQTQESADKSRRVRRWLVIFLFLSLLTAIAVPAFMWWQSEWIAGVHADLINLRRRPQVTSGPDSPAFFQVLSVRHTARSDGTYFDFDAADLDAILGRQTWDRAVISVAKTPNGPFRSAIVWRSTNGGPGSAHGRYENDPKGGDWRSGDLVYVRPVAK